MAVASEPTRGFQVLWLVLLLAWATQALSKGAHSVPHGTPSSRLLVHYRSGWHSRNEPELRRRLMEPLQRDAVVSQLPNRRLLEHSNISTNARGSGSIADCYPRTVDLHYVGLQLWELPPGCDVRRVTDHLSSLPDVAHDEDGVVHALSKRAVEPDDPRFSLQWMMREQRLPLVAIQRGLNGDLAGLLGNVSLPFRETRSNYSPPSSSRGIAPSEAEGTAHISSIGSPDVGAAAGNGDFKDGDSQRKPLVVAVIDSGVDTGHPDLQGRLWVNEGEIPNNGIDDDGNGYVDDYQGYNFLADSSDVFDDYFHGTHLAGIVGAECDNDEGVCGMDQELLLMPCKFLDKDGSGLISNAVWCLDYALQMGAIMTLNSYGGYSHDSEVLKAAINAAEAAGQLFITAAGNNDGRDMDTTPQYPAASNQTNVVTVAATDMYGQLAPYSNVGAETVDLAAPGSNIYSTLPGGKYGYRDGTSQAAGVVAGALALMINAYRKAGFDIEGRAAEFRNILMSAGVKASSDVAGKTVSGGILDVSTMLDAIPDSVEEAMQSGWSPDSPLPYHGSATLGQVYGMSNVQPSVAATMGAGLYYRDASVLSNTSITSFLHSTGHFALCATSAPDGRTIAPVLGEGAVVDVASAEIGAALGRDVTADLLPAQLSEFQANTDGSDGSSEQQNDESASERVYWLDLPRWFDVDGANISRVGVTSRGALVATTASEGGWNGYLDKDGDRLQLYPVPSGNDIAAYVSSSAEREGQSDGTADAAVTSSSNGNGSGDDSELPFEADVLYGELFAMAQRVSGGRPGFAAAGLYGTYDLHRGGQVYVTTYPDRVTVTYLDVLPGPSATSPARYQQPPVTFVVELFYSNAGGVPPGSVRTTFVEVGNVEGITGVLLGADDFRDGDEAEEYLAECVIPPELVLDKVASLPSALGIAGLKVTLDGKFSLEDAPETLHGQGHQQRRTQSNNSTSGMQQVLLTNSGGQTLYSSVAVEAVGVNLLQSWQWLEPSLGSDGPFFGSSGSSEDAANVSSSDFDDEVGTLRVSAGPVAQHYDDSSNATSWADELGYHQKDAMTPSYYGASGRALRFAKPLRLPAMVKARPVRAAECEDHFMVLSTNPYMGGMAASDSSNSSRKHGAFGSASSAGTHTFAFGLQCGRKTLRAGDVSVSARDGCAGFGLLTWSISVSADRVSFWDDACGALHIPGSFNMDTPYYLYVGAGCSYGGADNEAGCPEGALWTSVEVLKGLDKVSGLSASTNVTNLPASAQFAYESWSIAQLDVQQKELSLEYEDVVSQAQTGSKKGQSYSVREAPTAQRPPARQGHKDDGTVYAQATGESAEAQQQSYQEVGYGQGGPSFTGSEDESALQPWYDGYDSEEESAGVSQPSSLPERISGWRPGSPGWLPGSTPAAKSAIINAGFSYTQQDVKLSVAEEVVLQATWMGQQAPDYCIAELVLRTNDPLHTTVRLPLRC